MPGTMRKRGRDSWYLEVTIGTDFRGKPNRYSKTVHGTKKEAEKELARFYTECEGGNVSKASMLTIAEICKLYTENMPDLSPETLKGYEVITKNYIEPIKTRKAAKITTLQIQEWINYLHKEYPRKRSKEKGLSSKTVNNAFQFLSAAMNMANIWGTINNKAHEHVVLPEIEQKEPAYLNSEETIKFIECLNHVSREEYNYKVAALWSLFASLRKGEIFGLNEEGDIDFEYGFVSVHRARYAKKGGGTYEKRVKSKKSNRGIAVPMEIIEETKKLITINKERRLLLGSKWNDSPALFKGAYGDPLYPNMLYVWLNQFLKEHDIKHIGVHGLRHTHASMLLYVETNLADISDQLGHSSKAVTERYLHKFKNPERSIADSIASEFLKAK